MKHVDRTGLYIMVAVCMFSSCSNSDKLDRIERDMRDDTPAVTITPQVVTVPEFCLREYQYPRSHDETRRCFEVLVEEIREYNE